MPRTITDATRIREAIARLNFQTQIPEKILNEWLTGVKIPRVNELSGPMIRLHAYRSGEEVMKEGEWGGNEFRALVDGALDVLMWDPLLKTNRKANEVKPTESFGEMSLFAGVPRTATVVAAGPEGRESLVLEIDRPALRSARQKEKGSHFTQEFFSRLTDVYQQRGLSTIIEQVRQASGLALFADQVEVLKKIGRFRIYGRSHRLSEQGDEIKTIYLIRNGWVRCSYDVLSEEGSGVIVAAAAPGTKVEFLGNGNSLGLTSLIFPPPRRWNHSAVVMLRTEVLEIDVASLRASPGLAEAVYNAFAGLGHIDSDRNIPPGLDPKELLTTEKLITSGVIETDNLLVMDMDLCIRCGNCSVACQKVHGQTRLVRRGIHITRLTKLDKQSEKHILVPQVCIHCQDPECLTYCPTGAIHRGLTGQIDVTTETCTGCMECAQRCPYGAISMISGISIEPKPAGFADQIGEWLGLSAPTLPPAETGTKQLIAAKCNLCEGTNLNPPGSKSPAYSCEENCPTGSLVRVNPREYFDEAEHRLGHAFGSESILSGRNIHRRDLRKRVFHLVGGLLTLLMLVGGIRLWLVYGFHQELLLSTTLRGLSGSVGGIGIVVALLYVLRRRIYRRRAGALRYWLLFHSYVGLMATVAIAIHGFGHGGSWLTKALMFSFDVVVLTGIFGVVSYCAAPRLLTKIEGDPLLLEDLEARRLELTNELAVVLESGGTLGQALEDPRRRFASFKYLLRQILRPEKLSDLLASAREDYEGPALRVARPDREIFLAAVEKLATLRRLDALIFLHRVMKCWLPLHIIAGSLMFALMLVHILQVVVFAAR